jgi:Flp pilus assembly protein TadB
MSMAAFILAAIAVAAIAYVVVWHRQRAKHENTARIRRSSKQRRTGELDGKPSYLRPKDDDSYENFRSRKQ